MRSLDFGWPFVSFLLSNCYTKGTVSHLFIRLHGGYYIVMDLVKDLVFLSILFCTTYSRILRKVAFKSMIKDNGFLLCSQVSKLWIAVQSHFFHFSKSKLILYECLCCWCRCDYQPLGVIRVSCRINSEDHGVQAEGRAGFVSSTWDPCFCPVCFNSLAISPRLLGKDPTGLCGNMNIGTASPRSICISNFM